MNDIYETNCIKLMDEIDNLRNDMILHKYEEIVMQNKYKYLYINYETLFSKIYKDQSYDTYRRIKDMIQQIINIQKGKITEVKASEQVGTELAEKYVYSVLPGFDKSKHLK